MTNEVSERVEAVRVYPTSCELHAEGYHTACTAVSDIVARREAEFRPGIRYPHFCCDGHENIGHANSESEMCPLCEALGEVTRLTERCAELERKANDQ